MANRQFSPYAVSWFAMTMARQIEVVAIGVYLYTG